MEKNVDLDDSEGLLSKCEKKDHETNDSTDQNTSESYIQFSLQKRPLIQKMIFDDRKRKIKKIILEEDEYLNKLANLNNNNETVKSEIKERTCIFDENYRNHAVELNEVLLNADCFKVKEDVDVEMNALVETEFEEFEPNQDEFSYLPLELRPGVDRRHKVACVPEAKSLLDRRKARRENKERGFLCRDCHKLLPSFAELKKHVIVHQVETKHKCPECGKCFQRSCDLTLHRRVHSASKPHICTVCRRAFTQKINMLRHMQIHTDSRPFKCGVCPRAFISRPELDRHYRRHDGTMPHYCSVCKDRFLTSSDLKHHITMLGHEIGRASCSICGLLCEGKHARDEHVKEMHKKERKAFQCHDCGKKYSTKLGVTRHILSQHGNDGRFGCQFCGAHFYGDSSLQAHLKRHAGARDYRCNECDKTFYSATTLNRHFRTHTNKRPFICDICDRGFKAADARKRHQVSVHDRSRPTHACQNEGCTEVFTSRSNMLRHVRSRHYGIKPFKCEKCGDRFTSNSSLQYHLQRINKCTESFKKKRKSENKKSEKVDKSLIDDGKEKKKSMSKNYNLKISKTVRESINLNFSEKKDDSEVSSVKPKYIKKNKNERGASDKLPKKVKGTMINVQSNTITMKNYDDYGKVEKYMIQSLLSENSISQSDILNCVEIKNEISEGNTTETVVLVEPLIGTLDDNIISIEIKKENIS